MNRLGLLIAFLCLPATAAVANPAHPAPKTPAVATADAEPRARIRDDMSGKGLSPKGFDRWLNRHADLVQPPSAAASMRVMASTALPPYIVANNFVLADRDGNRRISADELADFVMRFSDAARTRYDS